MVKKLPYLLILVITILFLYPSSSNGIREIILGPTQVHKTIYVSDDFDENQYDLIGAAVMEWQTVTHDRASFDLRFGYDYDILNHIQYDNNSLVIINTSSHDPIIKSLDKETGKTVLGYFSSDTAPQSILVVTDRIVGSDYFEAVVMHELGHALGLSHLPIHGTIMFEYMEYVYGLTHDDVAWFCRAYYCDPDNL